MSSLAFGQNDMNPANRHPDPSAEAFNHFYNLDYDLAIKQFRDFTVAHPQSMEGWNYLAQAIGDAEFVERHGIERVRLQPRIRDLMRVP